MFSTAEENKSENEDAQGAEQSEQNTLDLRSAQARSQDTSRSLLKVRSPNLWGNKDRLVVYRIKRVLFWVLF